MSSQRDLSERVKNFVDNLLIVERELSNSSSLSLHEKEMHQNIKYKLESLVSMVNKKTFYSSDIEKIYLRAKFAKVIFKLASAYQHNILLDPTLFVDIGSHLDIKTKQVFYTIHAKPGSRNRVEHNVFSVDTKKEAEDLVKRWPSSTDDGITWYYSVIETLTHFGEISDRWPY